MKEKSKFYLIEGKVWMTDDRKLKFVSVSDPERKIDYTSMDPDTAQSMKEIVPSPDTFVKDAPQERLYRILTDLSTVKFLNEDSFRDVSGKVRAYLEEIEEWERMCLIRDISEFYNENRRKRKEEIDGFLKKNDKPAAKGGN